MLSRPETPLLQILPSRTSSLQPFSTSAHIINRLRLEAAPSPDTPWRHAIDKGSWEEFLRQAADIERKVTDPWTNTVIDRFYSLQPLFYRDSVNFQRASYAIECCTKLYSARVNSLALDIIRLLSSLDVTYHGIDELQSEYLEEVHENTIPVIRENTIHSDVRSSKHSTRVVASSTLVKSFDEIKLKDSDTDPLQKSKTDTWRDPLYEKIVTNFVDSSAKFTLLNTLELDNKGLKLLDSYSALRINNNFSLEGEEDCSESDYESDTEGLYNCRYREEGVQEVNLRRVHRRFFLKDGADITDELVISSTLPELENIFGFTRTRQDDATETGGLLDRIDEEEHDEIPEGFYNYDYGTDDGDTSPQRHESEVLSSILISPIPLFTESEQATTNVSASALTQHSPISQLLDDSLDDYFSENVATSTFEEYWKVQQVKQSKDVTNKSKPRRRVRNTTENYDNEISLNGSDLIDFSKTGQDVDFEALLETSEDYDTVKIPESQNFNCIIDISDDIDALCFLFTKPKVTYEESKSALVVEEGLCSASVSLPLSPLFSFIDAEYPPCSALDPEDMDYGVEIYPHSDNGDDTIDDIQGLGIQENIDSRVLPFITNRLNFSTHNNHILNYAKTSSYVNFKELQRIMKSSMGKLSQPFEDAENINTYGDLQFRQDSPISDSSESSSTCTDPLTTSQSILSFIALMDKTTLLYKKQFSQSQMPTLQSQGQNVSKATCFLALLTIASENNLTLTSTDDYEDVLISNL